ncbi:PilZ domain [Syntrophomonas zehnderi OL-4]|uniref:PilZ domain n=1 Tax=Syntrophomonas zehnderi OL-4 TaxID=690567 RepID=A0A0E4GAJ2_9FIRM|nr:PilZ domain-containing protein [Syntrophomonas zehnderi]CFX52968.1 PilZ domain [Syntrophomonas zehnderi OL-4]
MKKIAHRLKLLIFGLVSVQPLFLAAPLQAANRNDVLFDLKDSFNTPVSGRGSITTIIIAIILCIAVICAIYYYSVKEEETQRKSHMLRQEKMRLQRSLSPQKRNWYRIKTRGEFMWIPSELAPKIRESKYKQDQLIDISGGGLCFSTAESVALGSEIRFILSLGEDNSIYLNGKVVRVMEKDGMKQVSLEYIGIREGQRDKIIAWISKSQRNDIQKEKASPGQE